MFAQIFSGFAHLWFLTPSTQETILADLYFALLHLICECIVLEHFFSSFFSTPSAFRDFSALFHVINVKSVCVCVVKRLKPFDKYQRIFVFFLMRHANTYNYEYSIFVSLIKVGRIQVILRSRHLQLYFPNNSRVNF